MVQTMRSAMMLSVILVCGATGAVAQEVLSVGGCRIRPGTLCTSMNLTGAKLSDANLAHSQFSRSVLPTPT